jgi:hypothetical protein
MSDLHDLHEDNTAYPTARLLGALGAAVCIVAALLAIFGG